jgi:hypothetical protein
MIRRVSTIGDMRALLDLGPLPDSAAFRVLRHGEGVGETVSATVEVVLFDVCGDIDPVPSGWDWAGLPHAGLVLFDGRAPPRSEARSPASTKRPRP